MYSPQFFRERPNVNDALTDVIALLQPQAVFAKQITGAGRWAVTYSA